MQRFLSTCLFALCIHLLLLMPAWSQTITGTITGSVTDPTGAAVAHAKVTAQNIATGVNTNTETNPSGIYNLRFLQIGRYKITVESTGFNKQSTSDFALEVSQEARVDVKLSLGSDTQTVTVTETAPILNAENPETGDTITAAQATELPLQARNFSSLTTLVAGAVTPNPQAQNNVGRSGYNGGFFVNGNREQSNNYTLDGADINEAIDNYIGYSPNVDAIGELRIITGNATAEYGNANGGQVVMVTKSGTNQFHGNAFWFLENTNLNADSWSNKHTADPTAIGATPALDRSTFGGTIGGPIFKDRLFFFGDYQGARQHTSSVEFRSVATAAMRAGFAPTLGTTVAITNPAAVYLFAHPELYPLPNVTSTNANGIVSNYRGFTGQTVRNDQGDIKVDGKLTASDNVSGRFSIGRESSGYSKVSLPTDTPANNTDPYTGFVVNWTHVFSSNIVNEARAGFGRTRYTNVASDIAGQLGLTGNAKLGIPGTQVSPGISTLDASTSSVDAIGGGSGGGNGVQSDSIVNAFVYGDNLSWQLAKHTIKLGGQAIRYQANRNYSGNDGARGFFSFNGNATGDAWADFLTDQASSYGQGSYTDEWGQRQWRDALFFQDDWKVTPNLTINLGLRWEWDQPLYEVNNKQTNINLTTGAIQYAGLNGNSRALYNDFWNGYMPRLGFAFSPSELKGKFVIRGGYGITNFLEGTGANLRLPLNPPFFTDASGNHVDGQPYFQDSNGFPLPTDVATFSGNVRAWDPKLKPALIQQFNLTTETELNNSTSLVIAYLGQTGDHLVDPREGNQKQCPTCISPVSSLPGLSLVSQVSLTESKSNMNYNSLQITGRHRASHGLEFLTNYTWSKSLTNNLGYYGAGGGASASQSAYWQDSYNGGSDYGPAFFDTPQIFSFSGYYDLPVGRGRMFGGNMNRALDAAVGGWKVGAIASLHSGMPITIASNSHYLVNQRTDRGNHYSKLIVTNRSVDNWFGTGSTINVPQVVDGATINGCQTQNAQALGCAYGPETTASLGTARVGSERAPSYKDLDATLSKAFTIVGEKQLAFRADFFNVLNTTSLAPPSNNIESGNFGQITGTVSTERQIQLALKFTF
ncbi:TonB-dependent receptor [Granulicella sibirica]|uniref:Oar protein n=1 Tax=Granulicella sibirica TaxID=2479048 RepID=A0A4Q0T1F5_9BACT|nr:carboxypeptidase regulatory-like domain-containing protein [Granulicella sibirica]RXH57465.1 Oar protein [Granulicella sibirica]